MENNSIFIEKLRSSGLRPTKQRIRICKLLFDRNKTFHFTINDLSKILQKENSKQISVATIYNTINSFKKKGYLKEIALKGNKTFFDTNTKHHHHFYDENMSQLVDIEDKNISINYIPKAPKGKKIKSIEVLFKIEDTN